MSALIAASIVVGVFCFLAAFAPAIYEWVILAFAAWAFADERAPDDWSPTQGCGPDPRISKDLSDTSGRGFGSTHSIVDSATEARNNG